MNLPMDKLQAYFKGTLKERVDDLYSALNYFQEHTSDEASSGLRRIAHGLRGSGGVYGFPEITHTAGLLEDAKTEDIVLRTISLIDLLKGVLGGGEEASKTNETSSGSPDVPSETLEKKHGEVVQPTVLIIDDSETLHAIYKHGLADLDAELRFALTVPEALTILKNRFVSLIVLDLFLADADGRDVICMLRDDPQSAAVPIVIVSARADEDTRASCEVYGADEFIAKPFEPETLAGCAREFLSGSRKSLPERDLLPGSALLSDASLRRAVHILSTFPKTKKKATHVVSALSVSFETNLRKHAVDMRRSFSDLGEIIRRDLSTELVCQPRFDEFIAVSPWSSKASAREKMKKLEQSIADSQVAKNVYFGLSTFGSDTDFERALHQATIRMACSSGVQNREPRQVLAIGLEQNTRELVKAQIEPFECNLICQNDGREMVAVENGENVDALIVSDTVRDVDLPMLIKSVHDVSGRKAPVVFIGSGVLEQEPPKNPVNVDAFFVKPFSGMHFARSVARLLRRKSS